MSGWTQESMLFLDSKILWKFLREESTPEEKKGLFPVSITLLAMICLVGSDTFLEYQTPDLVEFFVVETKLAIPSGVVSHCSERVKDSAHPLSARVNK